MKTLAARILMATAVFATTAWCVCQDRTGPADEAAAMDFARANHPELADLLDRLRSTDRTAFDRAVRDLKQTATKLERQRESDPERYSLTLRNWVLESKIRLLTARLTMSKDASSREELKQLLRQRHEGRLELLRLDRNRLTARLAKTESQIDELQRNRANAVEQDLARIDRAIKSTGKAKSAKPPKNDGESTGTAGRKQTGSRPGGR